MYAILDTRRTIILLLIGYFMDYSSYAQLSAGFARSEALGGITSVMENHPGLGGNPSGIKPQSFLTVHLGYSNPYLSKHTASQFIALQGSAGKQNYSLAFNFAGSSLYRENFGLIAVNRELLAKFHLGIALQIGRIQAKEYAVNKFIANTVVGILYELPNKQTIGLRFNQPFRNPEKSTQTTINQKGMLIGTAIPFGETFFIYLEIGKEIKQNIDLNLAYEYRISEQFHLYAGYRFTQKSISFGFMLNINNLNIMLSFQQHYKLGYSPNFGGAYNI